MPQPRKHASHAERQAAYRKRRQEKLAEHLECKGLPPLPGVRTNVVGHARWQAAISMVEAQMMRVQAEMEDYYDARTERWKQGERADELRQKIEDLRAALELVTNWIA